MVRPSVLAVIAIVAAFFGGTASLLVAKASGWLDGDTDTVVLSGPDGGTPAAESEQPPPPPPAGKPLAGNGFDPARIYRERADGVVTVISLFGNHAETGQGDTASGSGFIASSDGYVLTSSHVITTAGEGASGERPERARTVLVEFGDGDRVEAKIVGWDVFDDVGLLKIDPGAHALEPIPLGDSGRVVVGQPVAAIGSPFGQMNSLSVGVVSATERSIDSLTSDYDLVDAIQTDAPINRGNSGGPLLDARGRAVGIVAQIRSESGTAEGVSFAVPVNAAARSMEQLIKTGRVRYAWVGITTQTVTPTLARRFGFRADYGAAIQDVIDSSPAAKAGLLAGGEESEFEGISIRPGGDLIVAIDGERVASSEDVVRAVSRHLPGETATFTLLRGGHRIDVEIVLGERPATPPSTGR